MNKPQFTGKVTIGKRTFNKTKRWDSIQGALEVIADGILIGLGITLFWLVLWLVMG